METINIKCRKCGFNQDIERTSEIPDNVHHLECNWCPKCEISASDYWEEYWCDENGNGIENE